MSKNGVREIRGVDQQLQQRNKKCGDKNTILVALLNSYNCFIGNISKVSTTDRSIFSTWASNKTY